MFQALTYVLALLLPSFSGCGTLTGSSCAVNLGSTSNGAEREVRDTATLDYAQSFTVDTATSISDVSVLLGRTGSFGTGDTLKVYIASDSGSTTPGTTLSSVVSLDDDDLNDLPTSGSVYTKASFSSAVSLAASTTYWVVVEGGYSASLTTHVRWIGNSTSLYDDGKAMEKSSGTWAEVPDGSGATAMKDFLIRVGCD